MFSCEGNYWDTATIKQFFDDFARRRHFDPLIPENWYPITKSVFISKVCR